MLFLNETALLYHDHYFSSFDKTTTAGLIQGWATGVAKSSSKTRKQPGSARGSGPPPSKSSTKINTKSSASTVYKGGDADITVSDHEWLARQEESKVTAREKIGTVVRILSNSYVFRQLPHSKYRELSRTSLTRR